MMSNRRQQQSSWLQRVGGMIRSATTVALIILLCSAHLGHACIRRGVTCDCACYIQTSRVLSVSITTIAPRAGTTYTSIIHIIYNNFFCSTFLCACCAHEGSRTASDHCMTTDHPHACISSFFLYDYSVHIESLYLTLFCTYRATLPY